MAAQTNFIDIATIWLHAGKGGDGAVSFHREKFVAAGGPDGGDGGRGGDIIFVVDDHLTTLMDFRYKRKYTADEGGKGGASLCHGKNAEDLVIKVPLGTSSRTPRAALSSPTCPTTPPSPSPRAAAAATAMHTLLPPPARSPSLQSPVCPARTFR